MWQEIQEEEKRNGTSLEQRILEKNNVMTDIIAEKNRMTTMINPSGMNAVAREHKRWEINKFCNGEGKQVMIMVD